jgi:hypothetical protein
VLYVRSVCVKNIKNKQKNSMRKVIFSIFGGMTPVPPFRDLWRDLWRDIQILIRGYWNSRENTH